MQQYDTLQHAQLTHHKQSLIIDWKFGNKLILSISTDLCHVSMPCITKWTCKSKACEYIAQLP